jgi:[ribosomal protein S5]-alanine N-acetyltransferase
MNFLKNNSIYLRPFLKSDINQNYLQWLNDPEVNRYSLRRFHPYTDIDAYKYIERLNQNEKIFSIFVNNGVHVGNIKYGPIDWPNKNCEISILIGEKDYWNKGIASEAIYAVSKHLLFNLDMHRIGADTCNPAFVKMVENLGWSKEGVMRERMYIDNKRMDYTIMSILKNEFKRIKKFEVLK